VDGDLFLIARNPEQDSKLPYLLRLPIEGGLVLKARDTWPRATRIYCHAFEEGWPDNAEIVEETRVSSIRRRGPVIDLVLDRARLARSQLVFTETRGRPAIFWQTQKAAKGPPTQAPGSRAPARSPEHSRSSSTRGSATPTGSQDGTWGSSGSPYRPVTMPSRTKR
jgi:hypothetical protein